MAENRHTLEELAELTQIRPRTIRHYIQQDLLLGPDSLGRNATYGDYHVGRLRVIRRLRGNGFTIKQIAHYFRSARPDEEIRLLGLPMEEPEPSFMHADSVERSIPFEPEEDSTLGFILARQSMATAPRSRFAASSIPSSAMPPNGPIELLLERLRNISGTRRISRRSSGEEWTRLTVTPDLELHVRGPLPPKQLELFEQVADQIRVILLGGDNA